MDKKNDNFLISYHSLRQMIGILGITLPFLCWAVNALVNQMDFLNNLAFVDVLQSTTYTPGKHLKPSISDFYYSTSGPLFTGVLITVAIFLFSYKGYDKDDKNDRYAWITDKLVANIGAISLLGIVVFPTASKIKLTDNIHIFVASGEIGRIHIACAGIFFLSMAVMSIVNFRRNPGFVLINTSKGMLYMVCGWIIIAGIVILAIGFALSKTEVWLNGVFVYVIEVIMLLAFGLSWLTKGKFQLTEHIMK